MAIIILIIKDNTNKVVFISSKQGLSNKIKNFYLDQYINKLIDKNIYRYKCYEVEFIPIVI